MKLLFDFFPIVLFFGAYKFYGIFIATAVAIAASFIQVFAYWLKHRRFENMHLVTLGLIVVFGGATLLFHDELFIKWKPSVLNWLFGIVFLASQYIGKQPLVRRMMGAQIELPSVIWGRLNIAWAIFFLLMGFLNLFVVYHFDTDTWVNFKLFGMMGLTIIFIILQAMYMTRYVKQPEGK